MLTRKLVIESVIISPLFRRYASIVLVLFLFGCSSHGGTSQMPPPEEVSKSARPKPIPCVDVLFGARYCSNLKLAFDGQEMAGIFLNEDGVGNSYQCISELAAEHKILAARFQGRFYDSHHFPKDNRGITKLAREFAQVEPLASHFPVYASLGCETDWRSKEGAFAISELKKACPHCVLLNVPMPSFGGEYLSGILNEYHGGGIQSFKSPFSSSLDGTDDTAVNFTSWKDQRNGATFRCIWRHDLNMKRSISDPTPRAQRKYIPSVSLLKALVQSSK